jgi:hypothetical protein
MELTAIALARITAPLEILALDPLGKASTLEALKRLGGKYTFAGFPKSLAEIDVQKGLELVSGTFGEIRIDKLLIYSNGIAVDTRSSTEDSEAVLYDLLDAANKAFGAVIKPSRIGFTSQVIFRSKLSLFRINPGFQGIANGLTTRVSQSLAQKMEFEPSAVYFHVDTSQTKINPGAFAIERRADTPFSENLYFSTAPLRTREHLEMIRQIEAIAGAEQ